MTLGQMLAELPIEERLKIERRFWELVLEAHNARASNLRMEEGGFKCSQCRALNDWRNGSCVFCRAPRPGIEAQARQPNDPV